MQRVVGRAGMLRVSFQDRCRNAACFQRHLGNPLAGRDRGEQGERVKRGSLVILWKAPTELRHTIGVRAIARRLVAAAKEDLDGIEVRLLPLGWCLGQSRVASRRQLRQRPARLVQILVEPERLVVAHRLAPIGER